MAQKVVDFRVVGIEVVKANLQKMSARLAIKGEEAMTEEANAVLEDSKANYVPKKDRDIEKSGKVVTNWKGRTFSAYVQFGGPKAPHALAVHEHPSMHSPPSWNGKIINFKTGGTKYLSRPLSKAKSGMSGRLARKMKV